MQNGIQRIFSNYSADIIVAKHIGDEKWWLDENGKIWWNRKTYFSHNAIYLTKAGCFRLRIGGVWYTVPAGHAVFVPKGLPLEFSFDGKGPLEKYYTHFQLEIDGSGLCELFKFPLVFVPKDFGQLEALFLTLIRLREDPADPLSQVAQSAVLLSLVSALLSQSGARPNEKSAEIPEDMQQAAEMIDMNLAKPIQMQTLAKSIGYSTAYFTKKFKAVFGRTPTDYIAEKKIALAKDALKSTDRTISDIACSLGFADASYFSTFFKARTGLSPAFYRKDTFASK